MSRKSGANKKLVGGAILLVALGSFLSFNGFGLLPGNGTGTGDGLDQKTGEPQISTAPETNTVKTVTETTPIDTSDGVLDIVIDERSYLVRKTDGTRAVIPLDEIGERAQKLSGNADGYKVRIARKKSAVYSVESALKEELEKQGVDVSAQLWLTDPVE